MRVNEQPFPVYLIDTPNTIKDRIAKNLNTLTQYVKFIPDITPNIIEGNQNINAINVLLPFLNQKELIFPINKYNEIKNPTNGSELKEFTRERAEEFFIITHEELTDDIANNRELQLMILHDMENIETGDIIGVWNKKKNFLKNYNIQLTQQTKLIKKHEEAADNFTKIPEIKFSKFEPKESQFNVLLGTTDLTISELFNIIKTTPLVPYATMGDFYKIYHTFTPPPTWLDLKIENSILLKVNGEIGGDLRDLKNPYKKYTQVVITIYNNQIITPMNMNMGHRNISRKEFINRVINTLAIIKLNNIYLEEHLVDRLRNELCNLDNIDQNREAGAEGVLSVSRIAERGDQNPPSSDHRSPRSGSISSPESQEERENTTLSAAEYVSRESENSTETCENVIEINRNLKKENPGEENIIERSVIGYFAYPNQTFHIPVWAELTMNDAIFSSLIAIDEAQRVSKIKQNVYLHVLFTDHDTISLTVKQTIKTNMYGMEQIGSNYTIVRLKTKTQEHAVKYQKLIARLFTLYNNEENKIISMYREYLPNFLIEPSKKKKIIKQKLGVGDIAPDIFVPNYSRKCLQKPTIITDEEAIKIHPEILNGINEYDFFNDDYLRKTTLLKLNNITTDPPLMTFPVFSESKTRVYQCKCPGFPYPGLILNTLNNKTIFPFIPCCYKKDQRIKNGSKWKHYFNREPLRTQQPQVQDLFVTNKILKPGICGVLPKTIKEMFSLLHPDPKQIFVRIGLNRTQHSFLEAILVGCGRLKHINPKNINDMKIHLEHLMNPNLLLATKQELYNYTIPEIQEILQTSMDATYFVHLLEQVYDCNIFIFTASNKMSDGELIIPPHSQMYLKFQPTRETILIYQHMGSESDNATFPQCELIGCKLVESDSTKVNLNFPIMSYSAQDPLIKGIFDVFQNINRSFNFDKLILPIAIRNLPTPFIQNGSQNGIGIISQIIDLYGKCRVITISVNMSKPNNKNLCSIVTDPLPPYATEISKNLVRGTIDTINTFIKKYNGEQNDRGSFTRGVTKHKIELLHQVVINNITKEIKGNINNLIITFLCEDPKKITDLKIVDTEEYKKILSPRDTVIETFNKTKKIAKLIFQYVLFYLSHFCQKYNIKNQLTQNQLIDFILKKTIIIPNYQYSLDINILTPKFNINSTFMKNEKIIILCEEMRKRILYQIVMTQQSNFSLILNYYKSNHISDYFENISDFIKFPTEYIFQGESAVRNLIHNTNVLQTISKNIQPDQKFPYFFYNTLIDNNIYLAQNTTTLELAIRVIKNWIKKKYNPFHPHTLKLQLTPYPNLNIKIRFYKYKNTRNIIFMPNISDNIFKDGAQRRTKFGERSDGSAVERAQEPQSGSEHREAARSANKPFTTQQKAVAVDVRKSAKETRVLENFNGVILGYRIDDIPQYTSLLEIKHN